MPDLPVFDLPGMLASARNDPASQVLFRAMGLTLARFLHENNLLCRADVYISGAISNDMRIVESDLTEEGKKLFNGLVIDKWMAAVDRSGKHDDVRVLQRGLDKVRTV